MTEDDVCRICRGEHTVEDPLYHPCRCAGSIKYVHRECLLEWLQHARTASKCELCGTRYTMVQRYSPEMPNNLYLGDYLLYSVVKAKENIPFMFVCVRGFVLVSCLAILTKYSLEFSTIASGRVFYSHMMSSSWHILCDRCHQDPPRESGAPVLDWLLSLVFPASELRSAWVDGILILLFFLVTFVILWVVTMWVLNEPAVVHDLEHIHSGEISHMDNGDDDMVEFDELNPVQENMIEGERNLAARRDGPAPIRRRERRQRDIQHPNQDVDRHQNPQQQRVAAVNEQQELMDHLRHNGTIEPNAPRHADIHADINVQFSAVDPNLLNDSTSGVVSEDDTEHRDENLDNDNEARFEIDPENDDGLAEDAEDNDAQRANEALLLREDEEEAEDIEALGFAVRGLIFEIFGGTNAEAMGEFGVVAFATVALVEFVYMIPYIMIRIFWRVTSSVVSHWAMSLDKPRIASISTQVGMLELDSLPGHFTILLSHFALLTIAVRYLELHFMPYLLKRDWGVSAVIGLYQFYAVLKALLMIMIEFLAFPQFCGSMLHLIFVPLTPTLSDHWQFCKQFPYLVLFIHWIVGFLYMHGIMSFVNTCRKFFRKGVLYFVHDGEAPDFIRAIVFVSVPKQIYRIGTSVLLYAFFILAGAGSVTLILSKILSPLNINYWPGLNVLRLWPLFILSHICFVPLIPTKIQLFTVVNAWFREEVWLYVLRFAARSLDLDSWLFGKTRKLSMKESATLNNNDVSLGYFVRAPTSSRFRDRKNLRLFVPVNEKDIRLDKNEGDKVVELSKYTLVWRPPLFWLRIGMLSFIVWIAATVLILSLSVVPLCVGRVLDRLFFDYTIGNDILLYSAGVSICLPLYATAIRMYPPAEMLNNASFRGLRGKLPLPETRDWFLVFIWSLLFTGMQIACPNGWAHWTVVWPLNSWNTVMNFIVTYAAGLYAHAWLNSIAASDFMLLQQALEILGVISHTKWVYWLSVEPVLLWKLWDRWSRSKQAQRWSSTVRDFRYLDGTEIKNYTE